jgi:hypothetical protein
MIDMKKIEDLMEAGFEGETQGVRFAAAYGRATVYLKMILETMPEEGRAYWLDRMEHTAATRRKEKMDAAQATQ